MKFFKNITTISELKTTYKKLALKNHPDMGGSEEVMKDINTEYDIAFGIISKHEVVTETPSQFRSEFYTQNGWKGKNYEPGMFGTDVAKELRKFLKTAFPKCRFSVTSSFSKINCSLIKADFNPFVEGYEEDYASVNQYYIDKSRELSDFGKIMFKMIADFIDSYRYSDCDCSIDYFNTNFYYALSVGGRKGFVQIGNKNYSSSLDLMAA